MSIQEKGFLQWFGGIVSALLIVLFIWTATVLSSVDVMAEKIEANTVKIQETKSAHKDDMMLIRNNITEIKNDTKVIRQDIKEILDK